MHFFCLCKIIRYNEKNEKEVNGMEKKQYSIASCIRYMLGLVKEYEPQALWLAGADAVLRCMIPVFGIYIPKIAVDLVLGSSRWTLTSFILFMIFYCLVCVAASGLKGKYYMYVNEVRTAILGLLFEKSLKISYEQGEQGEALNEYWKAVGDLLSGDGCAASTLFHESLDLFVNVICFALYSAVIGRLSVWMLLIIIVLSLADTLAGIYIRKIYESVRGQEGELDRKHTDIFCLLWISQ